jgi:hypothetical protein
MTALAFAPDAVSQNIQFFFPMHSGRILRSAPYPNIRIILRKKYSHLLRWKEELGSDRFYKRRTGKRGSVQPCRNSKAEQLESVLLF